MNRPCICDTYYYLYRMAGAVLGIYANSKQEAIYPIYSIDADGRKLDGAIRYTLRFGGGRGKFTAK